MSIRMNVLSPEHHQFMALSDGVIELNKALMDAGAPPAVLVSKNGVLCSPDSEGDLVELTKHSLATLLRVVIEPGKPKKDEDGEETGFVEIPGIPRSMVESYIDAKKWSGIPRVRQVARAPIIRPDFTVRWEPGWDEATHCWVTEGLVKDTSLVDAGFDIRRIFTMFPLTDPRMVADCIAAALTPLLSTAMDPEDPYPAFLVTARKPGSGKSEMAKFCSLIGNGGKEFTTWKKSEEMQKLVAAFASEDKRTVIFDNIKYQINSSDLESVITSRKLTFRSMATHKTRSTPCNTTWFFTSNGASMSSDLLRRSIVVLLDKDVNPTSWNDPVEGAASREPQGSLLVRFVEGNEAALVTLLCSLVENWRVAGCVPGSVSFSNFEKWASIVSGILETAGIGGMFESRADVIPNAVQTDEEDEIAIIDAIADVMGVDEFFSAVDLWKRCNDEVGLFGTGKEGSAKFLRDWFKTHTSSRGFDSEGGGGIGMGRALAPYKDKIFTGCPYKMTLKRTAKCNGYVIEERTDLTEEELKAFTSGFTL